MGLETTNPYGPMIWRIPRSLETLVFFTKRGECYQEKGRKQSLLRVAEENPPSNF
jgi:hypothetical protein